MNTPEPHLLSRTKMFNGDQERYRFFSETCRTGMDFGIYLPPQVLKGYPAPTLYFLSDLGGDGTESARESGIQRFAALWNIIVVFPDTSPRGKHIPDSNAESIGQGAGFYIDAVQTPWTEHYRMESHISRELPDLIESRLPTTGKRSITGIGMGGHGALAIALRNPDRYAAVSAFAPICAPSGHPDYRQTLATYLGGTPETRQTYDAVSLLPAATHKLPVLIDQGSADPHFPDRLHTQTFVDTARAQGFSIQYKIRPDYGHDNFFVASFIDSHVEFHAEALGL